MRSRRSSICMRMNTATTSMTPTEPSGPRIGVAMRSRIWNGVASGCTTSTREGFGAASALACRLVCFGGGGASRPIRAVSSESSSAVKLRTDPSFAWIVSA